MLISSPKLIVSFVLIEIVISNINYCQFSSKLRNLLCATAYE